MNKFTFTTWLLRKVRLEGDQAKKCTKNDIILWLLNHFGMEPEDWTKQMQS